MNHLSLMRMWKTFVLAGMCLATSVAWAAPAQEDPNALLRSFLKDHDAKKGVFAVKRDQLDRFFNKELAALIRRDMAEVDKTGEIALIDFDIIYFSQDPMITDLKIDKAVIGGILKHKGDEPIEGLATIHMTYKDNGEESSTGFQFGLNAEKEWRIDDIHYQEGSSLKELLEGVYPAKAK
ncbi:MAG: hypothetical protein ABIP97_12595 [Chthoniobacterales bacterium]